MKAVKEQFIYVLIFLMTASCGISDGEHKMEDINEAPLSLLDTTKTQETKLTGRFVFTTEEGEYGPLSTISILSDGNEYLIDEIAGSATFVDQFEYKDMDIPNDAVSACGAWWAGGGDYFYLRIVGEQFVVYAGWLDEMSPDDFGYHWEERMRLP